MDVIHFTDGATDPLGSFSAKGARLVPLADGTGDSHICCLHLEKGATIPAPSITHAATLLVVHGRITITTDHGAKIEIHAGMGAVFATQEPYEIESNTGSIIVIVEAYERIPQARGISTPMRIAGATWPSDIGVTEA